MIDKKCKLRTFGIPLGVTIITIITITAYLSYRHYYPKTNDAYVQANVVNIASQVDGEIKQVYVYNHELVKKGQKLFIVDQRPYRYALEKAQANLLLLQEKAKRIIPLVEQKALPKSEADTVEAKLKQAQATIAQAKFDLAHTVISAPSDGRLAKFHLRIGDTVNKNALLFALAEQKSFWIKANFKETQLGRIKVGQPVIIKIDMYPYLVLKGKVASLSPGTASFFSLLPADNTTGNWIKVVQRVAVKINFLKDPPVALTAGASATVTINTRKQAP